MSSILDIVVRLKLETYKLVVKTVAAAMGLIVAVGVVLNNFAVPLAGVTSSMLIIFLARRRVTELDKDERTNVINQKSSQATLSVTVVSLTVVGLSLILLSRQGILQYEELGFQIAMLGLLVMALKSFFDWYYAKQYGG